VGPEYKYIGNVSERGAGKSTTGRDLRNHYDSYYFVKPDKDQVEKAVSIQFHTTENQYVSDLNQWVKNAAVKGTEDFEGKKFQYYTQSVTPTMDKRSTKYIYEKGYRMPTGLVTVFRRIYGAKGNTLLMIVYYESISFSDFDNRSWENADDLSQKQIEYLRHFNERAKSAFELMS
jgi:hypothetical protein